VVGVKSPKVDWTQPDTNLKFFGVVVPPDNIQYAVFQFMTAQRAVLHDHTFLNFASIPSKEAPIPFNLSALCFWHQYGDHAVPAGWLHPGSTHFFPV